jgi:hypothetical protein
MVKTRLALVAGATLALAGLADSARADLVSLHVQAHGGGATGVGLAGDRQDEAFHLGARGGTYGAQVGVEILFIDVWVDHNQYLTGDGLVGTWTQFMTGLDGELEVGGRKGGDRAEDGRMKGGWSAGYVELGMGVGFGVGTGQQVEPPLDNSQVTDKGFLGQVHAGAGWRLTPSWSLGVQVPVQAGYLFKSGPGATANDLSTQYGEISAAALLALRFKIRLK